MRYTIPWPGKRAKEELQAWWPWAQTTLYVRIILTVLAIHQMSNLVHLHHYNMDHHFSHRRDHQVLVGFKEEIVEISIKGCWNHAVSVIWKAIMKGFVTRNVDSLIGIFRRRMMQIIKELKCIMPYRVDMKLIIK